MAFLNYRSGGWPFCHLILTASECLLIRSKRQHLTTQSIVSPRRRLFASPVEDKQGGTNIDNGQKSTYCRWICKTNPFQPLDVTHSSVCHLLSMIYPSTGPSTLLLYLVVVLRDYFSMRMRHHHIKTFGCCCRFCQRAAVFGLFLRPEEIKRITT